VVKLTGRQTVAGDVIYSQSHSSGVYNVSYLTPSVGTYSMHVALALTSGLYGSYFNNRWLFGTPAFSRTSPQPPHAYPAPTHVESACACADCAGGSGCERECVSCVPGLSPITSGVDPVIDFAWDSLITSTGQDYVSIRWTGFVQPAFNDVYNFTVLANDGVKLWVDGLVVIDQFDAESTTDALTVCVCVYTPDGGLRVSWQQRGGGLGSGCVASYGSVCPLV
jgi:hypothetical protein